MSATCWPRVSQSASRQMMVVTALVQRRGDGSIMGADGGTSAAEMAVPKPASDADMLCRAAAPCDTRIHLGAGWAAVVGSCACLWELEAHGGWGYRILNKCIEKKSNCVTYFIMV